MSPGFARPIAAQVETMPVPETASDLYLDLMKKLLTRAIVAKTQERHRFVPTHPLKRKLIGSVQPMLRRSSLELVRLVPNSVGDYHESGHMAQNRVEDAETMLGLRQLDHMQSCVASIVKDDIPGDLLEAGVWRAA